MFDDQYFETMLNFVLLREGGYVNDPDDPGGETNHGITHEVYDSYRRSKKLPKRSVKYITDDEVVDIYYNNYYKASGADKIKNPRLAMAVFDTSVNMGVSVAKELLKKSDNSFKNFEKLRLERYNTYAKNPKQRKYLNGWNNRVFHLGQFAEEALPEERSPYFKASVSMDVDEDGNVLYYYDWKNDLDGITHEELKQNFGKMKEQFIHELGHPTGGAAPVGCAGTYPVRGYTRADGVKVSPYMRTCGAKHAGKRAASEKYFGLKLTDLNKDELDELLDEIM